MTAPIIIVGAVVGGAVVGVEVACYSKRYAVAGTIGHQVLLNGVTAAVDVDIILLIICERIALDKAIAGDVYTSTICGIRDVIAS